MPTVSRPMPSTRGRRPVATSSRSPRSSRPVVELEDVLVAVPPRGGRVHAEHELDAVAGAAPRRAPRPAAPARGAARARRPRRAPTSPPKRRTTCASSTPTGPPPSTSRRRGTAFMLGRLAVAPDARRARAGRGPAGRSDPRRWRRRRARRCGGRRSTSTAPVPASRPRAAQQVDAVVRQPALLAGVGVVRDHEVPPRERGLDVDLGASPRPRARRAPPRPGAAASWRGCTPSRSTRRRPARARRRRRAARARPARRRSARRARRRRGRSRRSHWSSSSSPPSVARAGSRSQRPVAPVDALVDALVPGPDQGVHGRDASSDGRRCRSQQSTEVNMAGTDVSGEPTAGRRAPGRGHGARGRDAARLRCRPGEELLREPRMAVRHRPGRQRRDPHGAVHAAPLAVLDPVRQGRHGGAAGVRRGHDPRGQRHRGRPRRSDQPRRRRQRGGGEPAARASTRTRARTSRGRRSATRTATAGSSRRSRAAPRPAWED